ncbi:hypothetical protein HZU77_015755 [Neisseriaceae bacterium TC5R-5]|nr:hypothetical protein [Neisseriaceae bacterium TC5R-5]
MALNHDADGFLLGEPLDLSRMVASLAAIRRDVRAIRQALIRGQGGRNKLPSLTPPTPGNQGGRPPIIAPLPGRHSPPATPRQRSRSSPRVANSRSSATPRTRQTTSTPARRTAATPGTRRTELSPRRQPKASTGTTTSTPAPTLTQTSSSATPVKLTPDSADTLTKSLRRALAQPAKPAQRDGRGRFIRRDASGQPMSSGSDKETEDSRNRGLLRTLTGKLGEALTEAGQGMEEADPTVKAFKEVAEPLGRGFGILTNRGDKPSGEQKWLRRIFSTLSIFKKEEGLYHKIANQRLKAIQDKPVAEMSGSANGGLLSRLPLLGPLLAGGGKLLGGLLRRLPLIGALFGGLSLAAEAFADDDPAKPGKRSQRVGKAAGGLAGSLGGAWAGAKLGGMVGAIGGPIGVAIGSVVGGAAGWFFGDKAGQVIGENIGGWIADLRAADLPGRLSQAWENTTTFLQQSWQRAMSGLAGLWDSAKKTLSDTFNTANDWIKGKTGIDVKATAIQVTEQVSELGKQAATAIKQSAESLAKTPIGQAAGKVTKAAGDAVNYGADVVVDAAQYTGAKLSGKVSDNQAALIKQMVAAGITHPKEQAMFLAQMDHESGGFTKLEERFNYRSADRIMAVSKSARQLGKPALEAAMAQGPEAVAEAMYGGRMGNVSKGDAYKFRGRGHIQLTGRDQYKAAGKALGIDLVNRPDLAASPDIAAKVATWYWKNRKISQAAQQGDVETVTRKINGGLNGLIDRQKKYSRYLAKTSRGELKPSDNKTADAVPAKPATPTAPAQKTGPVPATPATTDTSKTPLTKQLAAKAAPAKPAMTPPVLPRPPKPPVIVNAKIPALPLAPSTPPPADAPALTIPLASSGSKQPATVVVPVQDVGQDVRDRHIAHIVTGGLSQP